MNLPIALAAKARPPSLSVFIRPVREAEVRPSDSSRSDQAGHASPAEGHPSAQCEMYPANSNAENQHRIGETCASASWKRRTKTT